MIWLFSTMALGRVEMMWVCVRILASNGSRARKASMISRCCWLERRTDTSPGQLWFFICTKGSSISGLAKAFKRTEPLARSITP